MKTALITGANKGIGFATARQLGALGYKIVLGSRDANRGERAAEALAAQGIEAVPLVLDVTDAASIARAARRIAELADSLDVLVNNAGVMLDWGPAPSAVDLALVRATFETNVFGAIAVTQALLPLLRGASAGRIVNLSSGLGSLTWAADPDHADAAFVLLAYNSSKAALNMATIQFANELRSSTVKVNAADPGYCATDLNGRTGPRSADIGARIVVKLATLPAEGPTGGVFNDDGPVPF